MDGGLIVVHLVLQVLTGLLPVITAVGRQALQLKALHQLDLECEQLMLHVSVGATINVAAAGNSIRTHAQNTQGHNACKRVVRGSECRRR